MAGTCPESADPIRADHRQIIKMFFRSQNAIVLTVLLLSLAVIGNAQAYRREISAASGSKFEIVNHFGRIEVRAPEQEPGAESEEVLGDKAKSDKAVLIATSNSIVSESEIRFVALTGVMRIEVVPASPRKRIDMIIEVPTRTRLKLETHGGEVRVIGDLESVDVRTETGTIAAEVPTDDLRYGFLWTASRPRFLADFQLSEVKEKAGGKFEIKGRYPDQEERKKLEQERKKQREEGTAATDTEPHVGANGSNGGEASGEEKPKRQDTENLDKPRTVSLNFTTARGIVLLNVPPNEVSSDLRERPLTEAAKSIIRSGDMHLMEAIRRASPKYFGDYTKTLPPLKREPILTDRPGNGEAAASLIKTATVRVMDVHNRAIPGLESGDFEVTENNDTREIVSVNQSTAPFNLVLLLDVSGSVDNYVNFIRKAARSFVNTVGPNDKVSIVLFNDDVKVLSGFSADKQKLSESLDSFDAGGGTAYYDAIAYTFADVLRPLRGERTAIVILTDGDDNRSFLPFDSLLGAIEESGALIYPLYVPSSLVAATGGNVETEIDPLRMRYMTLSTRATGEGEKLAKTSGGVYYPISQLSQIQAAYDDIVVQLRTAYNVTFKSTIASTGYRASPGLKVRVNRPNTFTQIGPVISR